MSDRKISIRERYKEAFLEGYNLVGLGGAIALSLATLNPLPALVALVAEAAYLLFVPDSKWYSSRLSKRFDAEVLARREELKKKVFPNVRVEVRDRFTRLELMRKQIEDQSKDESPYFREAMRKLDYLLEKYLEFALKEVEYTGYILSLRNEAESEVGPIVSKKGKPKFDLRSIPTSPSSPNWIDQNVNSVVRYYQDEIADIQERLDTDPDFPTRNVAEKRKEILERRLKKAQQFGLFLHNLSGQMDLMSDMFGLINDEIRARSPEQVLAEIDEVVSASNALADAIEEMAPIDELVAKAS